MWGFPLFSHRNFPSLLPYSIPIPLFTPNICPGRVVLVCCSHNLCFLVLRNLSLSLSVLLSFSVSLLLSLPLCSVALSPPPPPQPPHPLSSSLLLSLSLYTSLCVCLCPSLFLALFISLFKHLLSLISELCRSTTFFHIQSFACGPLATRVLEI